MERINRLVIDSTDAISDLCVLATVYPTDKSPFRYQDGHHLHRHPYTAVYDLLFAAKRFEPIVLGELGVLDNMSMHTWRAYFPNASLFGFDVFPEVIDRARAHELPNTHYALANVQDRASMFRAFNEMGRMFDVLIDDSTHLFDDQIRFVGVALEFVKPGGIVIVEDVFRPWGDARYCAALQPYYRYFSSGVFIETNHAGAFSAGDAEPYYDNDKLLVLFRNQEPAPRRPVSTPGNRKLLDEALARPAIAQRGALLV